MKNKLFIAALAALAALLVAAHLRAPYAVQSWRMDFSAAGARSGERLPAAMPDGDVAVNQACAEELEALVGIGPSLAQKIIDEREQNGDFHYPEDLINVSGIGEKTLERMREQLKLP